MIVVRGSGGGGVEVVSEGIECCTFNSSCKEAILCSNRISWPTISKCNKFSFPIKFSDSYFFLSCQLGRPC